jgi:hypothetical protein
VRALLVIGLLAGCNARLGTAQADRDATISVGSDSGIGPTNVVADAAPDAKPLCGNGRVIYLNFEGASLAQAATSDATQDQAVWLGQANGTLAQFRPGAGDRTTQIDDTVTAFKTGIAGHPDIQVVTTRPTTSPFFEIGFGGSADDVSVPYLYAVDRLDCGDTATKSDIGWVFEAAESPQRAANFALGALLFGLGATGTTNPNDCMCGWLTNCQASNNACTYSTSINAATGCNVPNPVNETTYLDHFCD